MTERGRNIAVGITLLCGVSGVALMLLLFGYGSELLKPGYDVHFLMDSASGLGESSRVKMAGIDIGGLRKIALAEPASEGVRLLARIERQYHIPRAVKIVAEAPMLLGGSATLKLSVQGLDDQQMADPLPTDGTAIVDMRGRPQAESIGAQMRAALAEPIAELRRVASNFESLATEWRGVGENLNRLLEPRDLGTVDRGSAPGNLSTLVTRADQRLREAKAVLEGVRQWVGDDALRTQVTETTTQARQTLATLEQGTRDITQRFATVSDELAVLLREARTTIAQASAGDGTLGRLVHDPTLYQNLNDAAQRLNKLLDETQLLIQKWKAEGLPVQF